MDQSGHQEIKCTVKDCRHHDSMHHCTLSDIVVGGTENNVTSKFQTDCLSFDCE